MPSLIAVVIMVIYSALFGLQAWLFRRVVTRCEAARLRGDNARARQILKEALRWPALPGSRFHIGIHYQLSWLYLKDRRSADAADQARLALKSRLPAAMESVYRSRLADCLEACGDRFGADHEREQAHALAMRSGESGAQLFARAKALRKAGHYSESIPVLERAVMLAERNRSETLCSLQVMLALSCWNAGRMRDALNWADRALASRPAPSLHNSALRVSALALANLGMLERADERWRRVFDTATEAGNGETASEALAMLAEIHRRRGCPVEALHMCEQARALSIEARRKALFVSFDCLLVCGRFEEAQKSLEQGAAEPGMAILASERRVQATVSLMRAIVFTETGRPDEALTLLAHIEPQLRSDEKLSTSFFGVRAWAEARAGRPGDSAASAREALASAARRPEDRTVRIGCHNNVGRAALECGDEATARGHFEACLALVPDPIDQPRAHYFLGLCSSVEGDTEAAERHWRTAAAFPEQIRYARLARERLSVSSEKQPADR